MLEKFSQTNKAENISRYINEIDFDSAEILNTERELYAAIFKGSTPPKWNAIPIAPLAEPVNLNDLVGGSFNGAQKEIAYHASRLDNVYLFLNETNNTIKAELETIEKYVTEATDTIQDISFVVGDESRNFLWVTDSFNSSVFVDSNKSDVLVDSDYGMLTLSPTNYNLISDFKFNYDKETSKGIPGCNLLIVDSKTTQSKTKELDVTLEKSETSIIDSLFDNDSTSWFEIERNFIPRKQKLRMEGRSFVYSAAGVEQDVIEATRDYDWKVSIEYPDGTVDDGGGKGIPIAEFRDLNNENINTSLVDTECKLVFTLDLATPQSLSFIKILPFIRQSETVKIDSIQVEINKTWITIAKDQILGNNKSSSFVQQEVLRRTGAQTTGSTIAVPTNRLISKIKISLSSKPVEVKYGFGHKFKDVETENRTERNHVLWRSADTWREWRRQPVSTATPQRKTTNSRPGLLGTVFDISSIAATLGNTYNSIESNAVGRAVSKSSGGLGAALTAASTATSTTRSGTLGQIGSFLGKISPALGILGAVDQLVGGLFAVEKDVKVLSERTAYDVFTGHRAAIALRDISLIRIQYNSTGTMVSSKRVFESPVNRIGLFVEESIPEDWGQRDWISYSISVDGQNWINIPKLTDVTLDKSVSLETPVKEVFFKVELKGNASDVFRSPIVKHYALQGALL